MRFVPGRRDKEAPYFTWDVHAKFAPLYKKFLHYDAQNAHWDWGFAVLELRNGHTVQSVLNNGSMGIGFEQSLRKPPNGTVVRAIGYPQKPSCGPDGSPCWDGERQWWCSAGVTAYDDPGPDFPRDGPNTRGIGCEMTRVASGGDWFASWSNTTGGQLRSVISYHPPRCTGCNSAYRIYGPYLGGVAQNYFEDAIKSRAKEGDTP